MTATPIEEGLRPGSPYGGDRAESARPLSPDCPKTDPPDYLYWGYHCLHDNHLRVTYGIGCADYYRLLANQDGACGGCGHKPKPNQKRGLAVDHDHDTHEIRGLLCDYCNRALNKGLVRYLAAPPARKLGPMFVPRDRIDAVERRKVLRAEARKARPRKTKARAKAQLKEPTRSTSFADQLAKQGD